MFDAITSAVTYNKSHVAQCFVTQRGNMIQVDNVWNVAYRTLVATASCIPPDIQAFLGELLLDGLVAFTAEVASLIPSSCERSKKTTKPFTISMQYCCSNVGRVAQSV